MLAFRMREEASVVLFKQQRLQLPKRQMLQHGIA